MKKKSQETQVINALKAEGGYATLKRLYEIIDVSSWKTKTPRESIRRIVQLSNYIFRIQPGLWALEEMRDDVLKYFKLKSGDKHNEEKFTHSYYQGLLIEIGKFQNYSTYIPPQDKNKLFLKDKLSDIVDSTELPCFTYNELLRKAKSVDVIWFNERKMPSALYEIEHTTDFKNSLSKFYELQDFYAKFHIVAHNSRKEEFKDKLHVSMFKPIDNRVDFIDYNRVVGMYENLAKIETYKW